MLDLRFNTVYCHKNDNADFWSDLSNYQEIRAMVCGERDVAVKHLKWFIEPKNTLSITVVDLRDMMLGSNGVKWIVNLMERLPLKELELDGNNLGECLDAIFLPLYSEKVQLKSLSIARNNISTVHSWNDVCNLIRFNKSLAYLDIRENRCSFSASEHLLQSFMTAFASNRTLKTIKMEELGFTKNDAKLILRDNLKLRNASCLQTRAQFDLLQRLCLFSKRELRCKITYFFFSTRQLFLPLYVSLYIFDWICCLEQDVICKYHDDEYCWSDYYESGTEHDETSSNEEFFYYSCEEDCDGSVNMDCAVCGSCSKCDSKFCSECLKCRYCEGNVSNDCVDCNRFFFDDFFCKETCGDCENNVNCYRCDKSDTERVKSANLPMNQYDGKRYKVDNNDRVLRKGNDGKFHRRINRHEVCMCACFDIVEINKRFLKVQCLQNLMDSAKKVQNRRTEAKKSK